MRRLSLAIAGVAMALAATRCGSEPEVKTFVVTVVPPPGATATAPAAATGPSLTEQFARACQERNAKPAPAVPPTVQYPADALLISAFPRDLLLEESAVSAYKEVSDGSTITAQWNRNWDREPAGSGSATRITNNTMLFLNLDEAHKQFDATATGDGGKKALEAVLTVRGAMPEGMCITPVDAGALGVDQQAAWRAEFLRGNQSYVTYWVYLRVRNVRATLQTFVETTNAAEQPALFEETKQLAAKQAAKLKATPATAKPEEVKLQDP